MRHIPPQSEPVDAKDLYRKLEAVLRDQESAQHRSLSTVKKHVRNSSSDSSSQASYRVPPPNTQLSTRPISYVPNRAGRHDDSQPPMGSRLSSSSSNTKRMSMQTITGNDIFGPPLSTDLQGVAQAARLVSKGTSSRPDTSYNESRQTRQAAREEVESSLRISPGRQRPKSLPVSPPKEMKLITRQTAPVLADTDAVHSTGVVAQSVQVVEPHMPQTSRAAPCLAQLTAPPAPGLTPSGADESPGSSLASLDHLSSTSTFVPISTTSQSPGPKDYRKSLDGRIMSKMNHQNDVPETIIVRNDPAISDAPPVQEIRLDGILPVVNGIERPLSLVFPESRHSMDSNKPRPRERASTTAFETYRFSDISFMQSSTSNSPYRLSDPSMGMFSSSSIGGYRLSDPNSTFTPNLSTESIPTLMPGAEKRLEWSEEDSMVKSSMEQIKMRRRTMGDEGLRDGSPNKVPYRVSMLRNELFSDIQDNKPPQDQAVGLQEEPPEDSPEPTPQPPTPIPRPLAPQHSQQPQQLEKVQTPTEICTCCNKPKAPGSNSSTVLRRRRTFDPRQLFSRKNISQPNLLDQDWTEKSSNEQSVQNSSRSLHRITVGLRSPTQNTVRSPSRSQPIIIKPQNQQTIVPVTPPPRRVLSSASSTLQRSGSASNVLSLYTPPKVLPSEIKHMTPASVDFLRSQEDLLRLLASRPATMSHTPSRAYNESGEIGLAISPVPPFQRSEQLSSVSPEPMGVEFYAHDGYIMVHQTVHQSVRPISPNLQRNGTVTLDESSKNQAAKSPNVRFAKIGPGRKVTYGPGAGSASMIELSQLNAKRERKWKKEHWWKVWRLL